VSVAGGAACGGLLLCVAVAALAQGPAAPPGGRVRKPQIADTVRANVYADNWFMLYVNGELVAVDSIAFIPHNVVSVDILPRYPMTIAVLARDNADPKTGMEYANSQIGDGGFVLKFGDGTVTDGSWKARCFSRGPIDGDVKNPRVESEPVPENWFAADFDDSGWRRAREYSVEEIDPKQPFFDADFRGAKFIWTDDVRLDNTVVFRTTIAAPPDGRPRADFSRINDIVPDGPPKGPGGRRPPPGGRPR
jgi:hypothetical protein